MSSPVAPKRENSHGEVLSRFAREHPESEYLLFLDADVCFLQDDTLALMLRELQGDETAFGITPRLTSNTESEIAPEYRPVVYDTRLHPCCALVKNTGTFQRVVAEVGLSCVQYLWARGEEYYDTFRLMTRVMKTYGLRAVRSAAMVQHFFSVSYEWEPPEGRLARLRNERIGVVFQSFHLIPSMTALENVEAPLYIHPLGRHARGLARGMLEQVGLGERMDHY